jgi:hypothetical protein
MFTGKDYQLVDFLDVLPELIQHCGIRERDNLNEGVGENYLEYRGASPHHEQ